MKVIATFQLVSHNTSHKVNTDCPLRKTLVIPYYSYTVMRCNVGLKVIETHAIIINNIIMHMRIKVEFDMKNRVESFHSYYVYSAAATACNR